MKFNGFNRLYLVYTVAVLSFKFEFNGIINSLFRDVYLKRSLSLQDFELAGVICLFIKSQIRNMNTLPLANIIAKQ